MHDNLSLRRIRTLFSKQISLAMIDIFPHNFSIEFLPVNSSPRLKSDSIFFYIIYCGKHLSSIANVNVFRIPFVFDALTSGTIKLNTQSLIRWATEYEGDSELGRKRIKEECCCWQSSDFCTQHYTSMLYERCTMYVYIIRNFKLKNKKRSKISFPYRMLSAHNSSRLEIQYNRLNSTPIKYRFFDRPIRDTTSTFVRDIRTAHGRHIHSVCFHSCIIFWHVRQKHWGTMFHWNLQWMFSMIYHN